MILDQLLKDPAYKLTQFSPAQIQALKFSIKNPKRAIIKHCQTRRRDCY